MNRLVRPVIAAGLFLLALLVLPGGAFGQPLPTPADFVRNLDVRCYRLNALPALGVNLRLDHLNPALTGVPPEIVFVGAPQDLCVPVFKNGVAPSVTSAPFIRFVDWKCYAIAGPSIDRPLTLTHLNPVIPGLLGPNVNVIVREPQQLCVPVRKNGAFIPAAVLQLIRWLDVKCYRVDAPALAAAPPITLSHLNPLITRPPETVNFLAPVAPTQLCVPVMKNLTPPPPEIQNIVRYTDVLCYRISGAFFNGNFVLSHLNPVLTGMGLPAENVIVGFSDKLCVPVAKNGFFPPG